MKFTRTNIVFIIAILVVLVIWLAHSGITSPSLEELPKIIVGVLAVLVLSVAVCMSGEEAEKAIH